MTKPIEEKADALQVLCATVCAQSISETYEVEYSTDTLVHEGVGGTNY